MTLLRDRRAQAALKRSRLVAHCPAPHPNGAVAARRPGCGEELSKGLVPSAGPWAHPALRRPRSTAGTNGNQPKPWLDLQGTGVARRTCSSPLPYNDWKGVGRRGTITLTTRRVFPPA